MTLRSAAGSPHSSNRKRSQTWGLQTSRLSFGDSRTALLWRDCDHAKQAIGIVLRACREEQLIACGATTIIAELNSPNIVDVDGLSARVLQRTEKRRVAGSNALISRRVKLKNLIAQIIFFSPC